MEGDQEKSEFKERSKKFNDLLGNRNNPASLYSTLWRICQRNVFWFEHEEVEGLLQEAILQFYREHMKGKVFENFNRYCCFVMLRKLAEFKRKKSSSIDYNKYRKDLEKFIAESKLKKDVNQNFIEKAKGLCKYFLERDVIDEKIVESRTDELIEVGKQSTPSINENILKVLATWRNKIKEKIRDNLERTDSLDIERDDDNGGTFRPFDSIPDEASNVETIAMERQFTEQLYKCIDELPPLLRETLQLRIFEELKIEEIAKVLERALSTIHERLERAYKLLAICMATHTAYEVKHGQ